MKVADKKIFLINITFYFVVTLIFFFTAKWLLIYLFPFIIGTVITIVVQNPSAFLSKKTKIKKQIWALLLVLSIYLLVFILIGLIFFAICYFVSNIISSENTVLNEVSKIYDAVNFKLKNIELPDFVENQFSQTSQSVMSSVTKYIANLAKKTIKTIPALLTGTIFTLIASCYIATDFDRFKTSVLSITKPNYILAIKEIKIIFKDNILKIITGYFKILLITFVELTIGLILLKVKNAIIISVIIAFLDLLPVLGTGTVLIPWGIFNLFTGNYYFGIGVIILYAVVSLVRNIIEPKIIGKQIGLHPLIALICVFIGLKLFGIVGIFILPIIVIMIYKMYDRGVMDLLFNKKI